MATFFTVWLAVGAGLTAGMTFTFSSFGMRALAQVPHPGGMQAMQILNRVIINPLFLFFFMGTGIPAIAVVVLAIVDDVHVLAIVAAALYLVGLIAVTIARNVPMNDALDAVPAESAEAPDVWADYVTNWTRWNHVRTVSSIATTLLAALALAA